MKVKAVFAGDADFGWYDNKRIRNGVQFSLKKESDFSEKWMEWVEKPTPVVEKKTRGRKKEVQSDDLQDYDTLQPFTSSIEE